MVIIFILQQISTMKNAFLIAILVLKSITAFSQSENNNKKYFTENISSLDIVEGIYDCSFRARSWNKRGNQYFDKIISDGEKTIINQNGKLRILDEDNVEFAVLIKTAVEGKYVMQMKRVNEKYYLYVIDFGLVKYTMDDTNEDGRFLTEVTLTKLYPTLEAIKSEMNKTRPSTGTGFAISKEGYNPLCG